MTAGLPRHSTCERARSTAWIRRLTGDYSNVIFGGTHDIDAGDIH